MDLFQLKVFQLPNYLLMELWKMGSDMYYWGCMGIPYTKTYEEYKPKQTNFDRKPKLYFTLGAARSGKSTKALKWIRREESLVGEADDGFPRVRWSSDNLRLAMTGDRYHKELEPLIFTFDNYAIKTLLDSGHDVLYDETCTSEATIKRLLKIDINAVPVFIDTPGSVCIFRAINTGQNDLIPVIKRHHNNIDKIKLEGLGNMMNRLREEVLNEVVL